MLFSLQIVHVAQSVLRVAPVDAKGVCIVHLGVLAMHFINVTLKAMSKQNITAAHFILKLA